MFQLGNWNFFFSFNKLYFIDSSSFTFSRGGAGNIKSHNQSPSQSRSRSRSRTRDFLHRATSRERSSSRDLSTQHHLNYGEEEGNTSLAAVDEETTKTSNWNNSYAQF